jgi:hypothetical protein
VQDAHAELEALSYADLRPHAGLLPADAIAARLKNEKTPTSLRHLDGLLLGHCGNAKHAKLLETMIDSRCQKKEDNGLEGLLIGYTLLRPNEGLARIRKIVSQPAVEFNLRYRALKALRFLGLERPDVLARQQLIELSCLMLDHCDIADLVIEDMRRLGQGGMVDRVLALHGKKGFDLPITRRAILRYAIVFSNNPKAAQFVEARRAEDPEFVEELEDLLMRESE